MKSEQAYLTVKQVAEMAGVSIRTLHHYHEIGLLIPPERTESQYRMYSQNELLRLQQILFYRALQIPLHQIKKLLNTTSDHVAETLLQQRKLLIEKQQQLANMVRTLDATVMKLREDTIMNSPEELFKGIVDNHNKKYKKEAEKLYGEKAVQKAEKSIAALDIQEQETIRKEIHQCLAELIGMDVASAEVQAQIDKHYKLTRLYWGTLDSIDTQKDAYIGLAQLYLDDPRFVIEPYSVEFAEYLAASMKEYARQL